MEPPAPRIPSTDGATMKSVLALAGFIALSFAVAAFGAAATLGNVDTWYATANKAAWNPPNWVFGPAWAVLYLAMAVAAWLVWRAGGSSTDQQLRSRVRLALSLYGAQLVLNALWTPAFFGLYPTLGRPALWLALGIIALLDVVVPLTIAAFWRVSRSGALLLLPYWLWLLFATTLNWAVLALNP